MAIRNYLIEGVSGTGKTAVCHELRRRGYHAINGDRELAMRGDPKTGEPLAPFQARAEESAAWQTPAWAHAHHIWDEAKVKACVADRRHAVTFFCGGSRNFPRFIHLFDAVFVLNIDEATLTRRLLARPEDEFGGKPSERELILRLHATKEDTPTSAILIDATAPLERVVDEILAQCGEAGQGRG